MYVVKKGDTLYSIAKQHGTTYQDIAKDNGISNPNLIHPGQTLNIGGNSKTATQTAQDSTKTVAPAAAQPTAPATNAPEGFEYGEYKPSDTVAQAEALLQQQMANKPGAYQSTWQAQLNDTINKILNREKFSYDLNGDALYRQYKDKYIQQGKMAMMDTMGQAQAMTGGYGNSYAQSVGQQAYQSHLQELNDIVPELYQMAYDQYSHEGQALYDQAALMAQQEDQEYGRYRDQLTDYYTELDRMRDDARYQAETDYGRWADDRNFSYDNFINDRNYQYQQDRDGLTREQNNYDRLANLIASTGYAPTAEELKTAGMTETQAQSFKAAYENSLKNEEEPKAVPEDSDFKKATFSRVDDNGNYVFYIDGKERTYAPGVNPYTGTKNGDTKYGTFDNGYQPNNVGGKQLSKSGYTDVINGVTQNVWKTPDGKLWIWDDKKNRYLEYDDGQKEVLKPYTVPSSYGLLPKIQ